MLIDTLKLPYSEVICEYDKLNDVHKDLWALPKILAYARQDAPFLHVDSDVFIWKKFGPEISDAGLIAQNKEISTDYYENMLRLLEQSLVYFPPELQAERKRTSSIYAYNAGILGGNDLEFFEDYTSKALDFIDKNTCIFPNINVFNFNIFYEQYLFHCLAEHQEKKVAVVFEGVIGDNRYTGLGDFAEVPHNKYYLHLLGNYKRNESVCEQMAARLRHDYPEYYYRIIALFKNNKLPLRKDHYWFEGNVSEQALLLKHLGLKESLKNQQHTTAEPASEIRPELQSFVYCRAALFKAHIDTYLTDLYHFENALWQIVSNKFSTLTNTQMLARDIACTGYLEYVFGDLHMIYDKVLVSDSSVDRIESKYSWIWMDSTIFNMKHLYEQEPGEVYTLVVPECEKRGYSLVSIDDLDILILEKLKEPKSILELFRSIEHAFDADDLASSQAEFKKLIFGRVKAGLINKSIKAVTSHTA
jgi:hypothetical protein